MAEAIPSLSTIKHIVHNCYHSIGDGEFRFDSLLSYLEHNGIPKVMSIGEDATRVINMIIRQIDVSGLFYLLMIKGCQCMINLKQQMKLNMHIST